MSEDSYSTTIVPKRDLEEGFLEIEDNKLPTALSEQFDLIIKANEAYDEAKRRESQARDRVCKALSSADEFIAKAKGAGQHKAPTHGWFREWTFKSDEIIALKENLKEIVACGIESAEAQKELVEVQSSLVESQTAVLRVSETQMEYQKQIAKATKVLYGFTALTQAQLESFLINLDAKMEGATKEELGEMAWNQLLLVYDQWKNQENILRRLGECERIIEDLNNDRAETNALFDRIEKRESEQDKRIESLETANDRLTKRGNEVDKALKNKALHDGEQDEKLASHDQKDIEHDSRLDAIDLKDSEQDEIIAGQMLKDAEHDRRLDEGDYKDVQQDELIDYINKVSEENSVKIAIVQNKLQDSIIEFETKSQFFASKKIVYAFGSLSIAAFILGLIALLL